MKKVWIILIALILLAGAAFLVYKKMYRPVEAIESLKVDVKIDESALVGEFTKDPQDANLKYGERVIELIGNVHKIEQTDSSFTIILDRGEEYLIAASVDKNSIEKAKLVKEKGDITLIGQYNGYLEPDKTFMMPGTIQLSRCYFPD